MRNHHTNGGLNLLLFIPTEIADKMDKYVNRKTYQTHSDMVAEALKQLIEREESNEPTKNQAKKNSIQG